MKTYTLNLTPPQLHEVLTALNVNKHKIAGRIRHAERKSASPEELEKKAADPNRRLYLETIMQCRAGRIETINGLLKDLEFIEKL